MKLSNLKTSLTLGSGTLKLDLGYLDPKHLASYNKSRTQVQVQVHSQLKPKQSKTCQYAENLKKKKTFEKDTVTIKLIHYTTSNYFFALAKDFNMS